MEFDCFINSIQTRTGIIGIDISLLFKSEFRGFYDSTDRKTYRLRREEYEEFLEQERLEFLSKLRLGKCKLVIEN